MLQIEREAKAFLEQRRAERRQATAPATPPHSNPKRVMRVSDTGVPITPQMQRRLEKRARQYAQAAGPSGHLGSHTAYNMATVPIGGRCGGLPSALVRETLAVGCTNPKYRTTF